MDYAKFEKFLRENSDDINVPKIQETFKCGYKEAKKALDTAVEKSLLVFKDGLRYEVAPNRAKNNGGHASRYFWGMFNANRERNKEADAVSERNEVLRRNIKKYVAEAGETTIPQIQEKFNLGYRDVYKIMTQLAEEKVVTFTDGLVYRFEPQSMINEQNKNIKVNSYRNNYVEAERREIIRRMRDEIDECNEDDDENDDDDDDDEGGENEYDEAEKRDYDYIKRRRLELEQRRQELLKKYGIGNSPKSEASGENESRDGDGTNDSCGDGIEDVVGRINEIINGTPPEQELENKIDELNLPQKPVNDLKVVNPIASVAGVLNNIAAKKQYEQSELYRARSRLTAALQNIAAAGDDKARHGGKSYSDEYFAAFDNSVSLSEISEDKYEIKEDNVFIARGMPFKVYLVYVGNKTYLSDEGQVYSLLSRRIGYSRAKKKIEKHIAKRERLKSENGTLLMSTSIGHSVDDYFSMYFVMRSLLENF